MLMLGQRRRWWPSNKTAEGQYLFFVGTAKFYKCCESFYGHIVLSEIATVTLTSLYILYSRTEPNAGTVSFYINIKSCMFRALTSTFPPPPPKKKIKCVQLYGTVEGASQNTPTSKDYKPTLFART